MYSNESQIENSINQIDANITSAELRSYATYEELELLSKFWQICIIILYTLTAAIAIFGNIVAICVLTFGKRSSKELRLFLVNLAMSDLLMALFSIPFTYLDFMLGRWIFAPAFCPIVQAMQMTAAFVSVYTLIAIGIDRYIAIVYPLFSQRYSRSFGPITISIIWLFGIILGLFQWTNTEARPFLIANETNYDCKEISNNQSKFFTIFLFIITFALPIAILIFTYGSITVKIFHHSTPGNADVARDRHQHSSKKKIIKMLVTICVLFVVCWLPLHILNLFIYFARDLMVNIYNSSTGFSIYVTIAFTAHWLSMANSCVNPIIYCFMSENFRADLMHLLPLCLRKINIFSGADSLQRTTTILTATLPKKRRRQPQRQRSHRKKRKKMFQTDNENENETKSEIVKDNKSKKARPFASQSSNSKQNNSIKDDRYNGVEDETIGQTELDVVGEQKLPCTLINQNGANKWNRINNDSTLHSSQCRRMKQKRNGSLLRSIQQSLAGNWFDNAISGTEWNNNNKANNIRLMKINPEKRDRFDETFPLAPEVSIMSLKINNVQQEHCNHERRLSSRNDLNISFEQNWAEASFNCENKELNHNNDEHYYLASKILAEQMNNKKSLLKRSIIKKLNGKLRIWGRHNDVKMVGSQNFSQNCSAYNENLNETTDCNHRYYPGEQESKKSSDYHHHEAINNAYCKTINNNNTNTANNTDNNNNNNNNDDDDDDEQQCKSKLNNNLNQEEIKYETTTTNNNNDNDDDDNAKVDDESSGSLVCKKWAKLNDADVVIVPVCLFTSAPCLCAIDDVHSVVNSGPEIMANWHE